MKKARRSAGIAVATVLATATWYGCGEETPMRDELARPGEREAVPFDPDAEAQTREEKAEAAAETTPEY